MRPDTNEAAKDAARIDHWIDAFLVALSRSDIEQLTRLINQDADWRDVLALTDRMVTTSGAASVVDRLVAVGAARNLKDLRIDQDRCPPVRVVRAGIRVLEAILTFETVRGRGAALVRFPIRETGSDPLSAWTLLTALEDLRGYEEQRVWEGRDAVAAKRGFHDPNWLDERREASGYVDRDPDVLIVGGGHAGLTAAARLVHLGVDTLVIDRERRIGDNWRLRYHGLKLHNQIHSNHLPYLPFPSGWPTYIPKDRVANWLEFYVDAMEINFWTETSFLGAEWDEEAHSWRARIEGANGSERTLRPRHIIMATSVSGRPKLPDIPTLERFSGEVLHSSGFRNGAEWSGRPVFVFGTGTSAHDIAQDLQGRGAQVTMVQRSPSMVVNIEPSAQLYDGVYLGDGPSMEDRDLINLSVPLPLLKKAHKLVTDRVKEIDAPLLKGLEAAGFELEFGEDGTGWPLKYRQRGGGYYFNAGCSDLIASGAIKLIQYRDMAGFEPEGVRMSDGRVLPAELVVLATGYEGLADMVRRHFGQAVADRVGPIWGFDETTSELRNMWMVTGQPGLWFTGGAFSQCRIYSKYLALQIKAAEIGQPFPH